MNALIREKLVHGWARYGGLLDKLLVGDRAWGRLRLLGVPLMVVLFYWMSRTVTPDAGTASIEILTLRGMRYLVLPAAAFFAALLVAASYVKEVYELPHLRTALRYLLAAVFSIKYPRLTIEDGHRQLDEGEESILDTAGGPGLLDVRPGNAVLLERLTGPTRVVGSGLHLIGRDERIREIANLEDQHGNIDALTTTTKDGIEVVVRGVRYRYRLRPGKGSGDYIKRTPVDPYPFSVQAVRDMAYRRSVSANGTTLWANAVRLAVDSAITDYISQHTFEHLTARSEEEKDPRVEIARRLISAGIRERLKSFGAELLWFDIGHFDTAREEVEEQRVENWSAKWEGNANVTRAKGDAYIEELHQEARAKALADMLHEIVDALDRARMSGTSPENLRKLILIRTAQILEAMVEEAGPMPPQLEKGK